MTRESMLPEEVGVFHSEMSRLLTLMIRYSQTPDEIDTTQELSNKLAILREKEISDESGIKENFWNEFEDFLDRLELTSEINKKAIGHKSFLGVPIVWGFWTWLHEQAPIPHGYSEKHFGMFQGPSNPSGRHVYRDRPKRVRWRIHPVMDEKGGVRFYTATAPICEIDAVSSVPYIPPGMTINDVSKRVLDPNIKADQWQRGLNTDRIVSIRSFIDSSDNSFSNAAMIYAPESSSVDWEMGPDGIPEYLLVDFQFLKQDPVKGQPYLTDYTNRRDHRPLRIIDGQHRVRGGMRSKRGSNLQIPMVLFPPSLGERGAAKFFAEVNTLAEPLNVLHEIFMRHKFSLGSNKPERTYAQYDGTKKTYRDRANRLAYESAAFLNNYIQDAPQVKDSMTADSWMGVSALFRLIRMLEENTSEKNYVISVDQWVNHAYKWFTEKGPYPPPKKIDGDSNKEEIFKEIANYFDAFMLLCNMDFDVDGTCLRANKRWAEGDSNWRWLTFELLQATDTNAMRPYIQYNTAFRSLLVNYPHIVKTIRDSGYSEQIISRSRFMKAVRVWGNIDWLDPRIKDHYVKSGEPPWQSLARWMKDAMELGEQPAYTISTVMAEDIPSERGKGILSPISEGEIEFVDDHRWPTPDKPVRIALTRPINASRGCKAHLMTPPPNLKSLNNKADLKVNHSAKPDLAVIELNHWSGLDQHKTLWLRVTWGNAVDRNVSSTLKLKRK